MWHYLSGTTTSHLKRRTSFFSPLLLVDPCESSSILVTGLGAAGVESSASAEVGAGVGVAADCDSAVRTHPIISYYRNIKFSEKIRTDKDAEISLKKF